MAAMPFVRLADGVTSTDFFICFNSLLRDCRVFDPWPSFSPFSREFTAMKCCRWTNKKPRRCGELRGRKTLRVLSCINRHPEGVEQAASTSVVGFARDAELCFECRQTGSGGNASGRQLELVG